MDRTDIQITTALSSYRAHTRPHGGKCGGEGDGGLEAHEHLDTSRPALQHHLKLSCGQRRARSYHPGRHPPPGPPAVHGRDRAVGQQGSAGCRGCCRDPHPGSPKRRRSAAATCRSTAWDTHTTRATVCGSPTSPRWCCSPETEPKTAPDPATQQPQRHNRHRRWSCAL